MLYLAVHMAKTHGCYTWTCYKGIYMWEDGTHGGCTSSRMLHYNDIINVIKGHYSSRNDVTITS